MYMAIHHAQAWRLLDMILVLLCGSDGKGGE
jgi:hypothetical protein